MSNIKLDGMSDRAWEYVESARQGEAAVFKTAAIAYERSAAGRHEKILKEIASDTKSLDELKRIADAAEVEAQSAKKNARFSKVISVLALLVSAGSLIVAIVALAVG